MFHIITLLELSNIYETGIPPIARDLVKVRELQEKIAILRATQPNNDEVDFMDDAEPEEEGEVEPEEEERDWY